MATIDLEPLTAQLENFSHKTQQALLPALHLAQSIYSYIPEEAAVEIARILQIPLAEVNGVIEFYSLFYKEPVGKKTIRVCTDPACCMAGSEELLQIICKNLGLQPGETSLDGEYRVERSPCLGLCEHAPALLVNDRAIAQAHPSQASSLVEGIGKQPHAIIGGDIHWLTANCGRKRPTRLSEYQEKGGYQALKIALGKPPAEIIQEVTNSGLVGRGGAAFPTGIKWSGAANATSKIKYIVCNADESEPGTFKDRVLMEEDPHRVIEGTLIAGYAIKAQKGYIYIRGEYPNAFQVLSSALEEARQYGLLGENILGSDFNFDLELFKGAGAYICGEETALFESIEGKRGFPRLKPPFPTTYGLFGAPTVINNVETLCNIPQIIEYGAAAYRQVGTEKSPGSKLFCLSGDILRPGLYEIPFGTSLRRLINDLAGGLPESRNLQAILLGGAAGTFATADHLDIPLTFEDLKAAGLSLGSGVILVIDDGHDLLPILKNLARFFAHESCGKCFPCRLGTQCQFEILERLSEGRHLPGDRERLLDIGLTMSDASLCGLGQTAGTAILSAIKIWPSMFETQAGG